MANVREIDRGWNRIKRELGSMDDSHTKVGVQQGTTRRDMSDMVTVAAANEIGTRRIPSRPFMRNAFDENKARLVRLSGEMYGDVVSNQKTVRRALETMGEFMTAKVKGSIRRLRTPPNAPSTIARKKSDNPLIDQGQLVQSITHVEVLR